MNQQVAALHPVLVNGHGGVGAVLLYLERFVAREGNRAVLEDLLETLAFTLVAAR